MAISKMLFPVKNLKINNKKNKEMQNGYAGVYIIRILLSDLN